MPGEAITVPTTAIGSETINAVSERTIPAPILAAMTRSRLGMSVNVINDVRCVHSEVTSRMPMIGRSMLAGHRADQNMSLNLLSTSSPKATERATRPPMRGRVRIGSQKPARVSTILRSSTPTRRAKRGRSSAPRRAGGDSTIAVAVLMR
jgi:hypothetical protein